MITLLLNHVSQGIELGLSPSQDRVLIHQKHKPPKPVVVGSKPTRPVIRDVDGVE
jgi:hypothetical protein